jgi:cellulose synthase (UDP-forming)
MSELRGIVLVTLGLIALAFYYSWWLMEGRLASPWLILGFMAAIFYGTFQILANWLVYLWTHHRPATSSHPPTDLTVDVFVTACGEDHALIRRSLTAACAMQGSHRTWLLDDGQDPDLAHLAKRLGTGYLTRQDCKDAKAGNVNAALARTNGDVVVIFDIDHVPEPDFLQQTLGNFADPSVGFVQVMPTFSNNREGWVARAATETSFDFYNPTSKGMDGFQSVTKMGSNSLIRRAALNSIGGYQRGLAEDLATSIALHAAGWRSRYVDQPLAPGLAPPDLAAWFTQQFKWSRGVFEVLLTTYPRLFWRLTWGERLSYAVRTTKYLIGPVILIHLALVIAVLISGSQAARVDLQQYLVYLTPLALLEVLIRQLALRRWRHPSISVGPMWRAVTLIYATWPVYTLTFIMAVLRLPLSFRPTPKRSVGSLNPLWVLPQLASVLLIIVGVVYSLTNTEEYSSFVLLFCFAACLAIPQVGLVRPLLRSSLVSGKTKALKLFGIFRDKLYI